MRAVHWLHRNSRALSSSDTSVMLMRHYHIMSHLCVFKNFWELLFKKQSAVFDGEQEKESIFI